jgi:tetratricopeptide (TPR) repeat protein
MLTFQRLAAVCVALLISLTTVSSGQTRSPAAAPAGDPAERAFNAGQYEQVDALLKPATDPRSVALRAKAAIARGRYSEADMMLAPAARQAPGSDAALELGLLQIYLGRRADGVRTLQGVINGSGESLPADLVRLGLASRALAVTLNEPDRFKQANGFLRNANRLAPDDPVVNTTWGDLFLETYDRPNAIKSYQDALRVDADYVPARVGLAKATIEENPPVAKESIDKALAINPNYVPAHLLIAELALDNRARDDARASIKKALEINPASLEAKALDAAIAFLEARTDDFERIVAEVLTINPVYGEVYRVAGDHAARNYRFDEAVELARRALMVDKDSSRAYADLGMHLLRTGDEPAARRALETSFKADPYDLVTYNSLQMLDTVDKFETIREGDLIVRLHPDEAAVMREVVMPLAQQALSTLSKEWDFKPTGPILVEMFPKHDDFAVRTIGLPGFLGALGACFGKVVTLDSPRARPPGEFSWESTLWHEMAHVITVQMSNQRIPRWLTEGISVFEEKRARPEWGREMEVPFAQALDAGKLMKLRELNEGFSDPKLISLSYYQASLVVEHIIALYGEPKLRDLVRVYGTGLEDEEAIKAALNTTFDQLQASFDAKLDRDYAALRAALKSPKIAEMPTLAQLKTLATDNPGSFRVQMELADALRESGDTAGAIQAAERASRLIPLANGPNNPNAFIAAIALEQGDTPRAIQALEAVVKVDSNDVEAARKLAALIAPLGDEARTAAVYQMVAALDPFDVQAQTAVGRYALKQRDTERAIRAFRAALAGSPPDRAAAYLDLAEAHFQAGQLDDAKRQALAALEIAPSFERAQDLLLKIVEAQPRAPGGGV